MSDRGRRIWLATVAVVAGCLCLAAVAWACTPTADLTIDPSSGAPGTPMTFVGHGFANGPVQIRMDSVSSAPLLTATGPDFSVTISVPQTSPGYHVFGAAAYDASGNDVGSASVSFKVASTAPAPQQPVAPAPRQAAPPAPTRHHAHHHHATTPPHRVAAPPPAASPPRAAPAPARTSPAPSRPATQTPAVVAVHPAAVVTATPTPTAIAPRSPSHVAAHRPAERHVQPARPHATYPRTAAPPAQAALWTPTPAATGTPSSSGPSAPLAIGAGMLAIGLIALFAGFTVAEVRRRRAFAKARRR